MILLDTHVLLWHRQGDRRLGPRTIYLLETALQEGNAAVSAMSFWEVAMRVQKAQLGFRLDPNAWREMLLRQGVTEIPIDGATAVRAGLLDDMHGDPADRLIVATALAGHQLVTADQRILDWPGNLGRLDARE